MCTTPGHILLSNEELTISINAHGAELCSIRHNDNEYLWQADPAFWKRHSPVLFPIVGSVRGGYYRVGDKEYQLPQHGFARDMDFTLLSQTEDEVWYRLTDNEETLAKYPYPFVLEIGYKIEDKKIRVMWRVENPADKQMDFQIGAHPAFYYRGEAKEGIKGYFIPNNTHNLKMTLIGEQGCADVEHHYPAPLDTEGLLPIKADTFDRNALIFEDSQIREITLTDSEKVPYLKMTFDTPLVGLWAPSAESPFVCIEPWYGRCDRVGYDGQFKDRDWIQHLNAGETFEGGYIIEIL